MDSKTKKPLPLFVILFITFSPFLILSFFISLFFAAFNFPMTINDVEHHGINAIFHSIIAGLITTTAAATLIYLWTVFSNFIQIFINKYIFKNKMEKSIFKTVLVFSVILSVLISLILLFLQLISTSFSYSMFTESFLLFLVLLPASLIFAFQCLIVSKISHGADSYINGFILKRK